MEITIYELLGLIKEGKAPKKIKYPQKSKSFLIYNSEAQDYIVDDTDYLFSHLFRYRRVLSVLNDEVEIIEEKKIETLKEPACCDNINEVLDNMRNKINEIIDVINDMRDKEC